MKTSMDVEVQAERQETLPWPSLLVLGAVTFVVVTGEMLPTAVLPHMSADLGVPEARTGLLVSIWAATVVVASFPLVAATARWNRRDVLVGALLVFGAASAVTATADTFAVALAGRLLGAAVTGLLWSTVNAHAAAIVSERLLARAVAVVLSGATLGIVLGVPAANLAAQALDWRAAFLAVGVAGAVVALAVRLVVVQERTPEARPSARPADGRADPALRAVLTVAALSGLVLVGHFAVYTFIATLLGPTGARVPGGVSGLLLLFGAVSAAAVLVVGRIGDRRPEVALAVTAVTIAAALAAVASLGAHPVLDVVVVAVWGFSTGALPPLAQTMIMRLGGPRLRRTAGTVVPVTFNLGIAVGAGLGSAVVGEVGTGWLPGPAAAVVAVAAAGLAVSARRPQARSRTASAAVPTPLR
jgi:predicted MFS family arabinose efflux permease